MKILVVSDAHGNKFGLEAVLKAGRECQAVLCLGDIVGYGAHPNECCELLREHHANCLSGNHDAAALGKVDVQWFNPVAKAAIEWTGRQLTPENRSWLDGLPASANFPALNFQAVHASLRQPWHEYIVNLAIAETTMGLMSQPLCFYGHTHEADVYSMYDDPQYWPQFEFKALPDGGIIQLNAEWKYLINPGSCGQPRDGNPKAKFAIYDTDAQRVGIFAIDYDREAAREAIYQAGLPRMLGDRLMVGK